MKTHKITSTLLMLFLSTTFLACAQSGFQGNLEKTVADGTEGTQDTPDDNQGLVDTPAPAPTEPTQPAPPDTSFRLDQEVAKYKTRYGLKDPYTKLIDNRGQGYSDLWGARNFRVVLHGVLYRGGANNKYFDPPRSNVNPLPTKGLQNLCEGDFSSAIYLYSENYSTAPKTVNCKNTSHQDNTFKYVQAGPYNSTDVNTILTLIYNRIKGKSAGPIYTHCWNGWHASGVVSGMALKQFCGWSDDAAEKYWIANTDGNSSGHDSTKKRLRAFKPIAKFNISKEEQAIICP